MNQQDIDTASQIAHEMERKENISSRMRAAVGLGFISCGMAATGVLIAGSLDDERFAQEMPFSETAQNVVNSVDDVLGTTGTIVLPASLLGIGAVKLGAVRSSRLRSIDKRSSQELSDDGHSRPGVVRRSLRSVAAGSMPVVVGASAAVGALTTGIGTEITEGPSRPITSLDNFAKGESMIVQYEGAMPMLESKLSEGLADSVTQSAAAHDIGVTAVSLGLHSLVYKGDSRTALTLGVSESRLPYELRSSDCDDIPVLVDEAARIENGATIHLNGIETYVVGEAKDISATNRIGVVMSQEALENCINKNDEVQSHALVLDTDLVSAQEVLDDANASDEIATVISKDRYVENSEDFWESNVKPITNTLALVGLMTSFIAMGGNAVSRMLRNRRELAAKLAAGESVNRFRVTELVRAAKDGVLGSTVGVTAAAALTVPVNALESGMRAGLGLHEAMVGYAVGIVGTMGGTLMHIIRPGKVVDRSEHTRV